MSGSIGRVLAGVFLLSGLGLAREVTVVVDNSKEHQTMEGFGASTRAWSSSGIDRIGPMRSKVLDAVYGQVKLTVGDIHCAGYEGRLSVDADSHGRSRGARLIAANDDGDPSTFNWPGFSWHRSDYAKSRLVDIAKPMGFDSFMLRGGVNTRWGDKWLNDIRKEDYRRYLQEAAENVVAILVRWRDEYGIVPGWHQPFNEPTSGNREVWEARTQEIVDLVKAIGARMRAEGFKDIKMVVPSEETVRRSLKVAQAILNDPEARRYVGAVSYHSYPYGSTYCKISKILATSGSGRPDERCREVRSEIRDLAERHDLQVWMTEVSHGTAGTFDTLRGRAIHIHDELLYAGASSYWAMWNMWSTAGGHGGPRSLESTKSEDTAVIFDPKAQEFRITGIGYAIGHYARWINRGAVRVEAVGSAPLLQVTAFRDDGQGTVVLVLINNQDAEAKVSVDLKGFKNRRRLAFRGEQSTSRACWAKLRPFSSDTASSFSISLPAKSVTTVSASLGGAGGGGLPR